MVMFHNSFVKPSLIVLSLFLCFVPSFCSDRIVPVKDICSKHKIPYNCAIILNAIPGVSTNGAVLGSLSSYLITIANTNAFNTITLIHELIRNTSDTNLKQPYITCSMDYNDALLSTTYVKDSFNSGNFIGMNSNAAIVVKDIEHCGLKAPDSIPLLKYNQPLEDVTNIIMILADYLAGKY